MKKSENLFSLFFILLGFIISFGGRKTYLMKKIITIASVLVFTITCAQITLTKDINYGNNGVVTLGSYVTSETDYIKPMDNGEVLLSIYNPGGAKFIKLKSNGTYDNNFGSNGILTVADTQILSFQGNYFYATREIGGELYLRRYYVSTGNLDTSFANNGVLDVGFMLNATMITLPDGKILIRTQHGFKRYSSSGVLDTTFANNGFFSVPTQYGTHNLQLFGNNLYEFGPDNYNYGVFKRDINIGSSFTNYGTNGQAAPVCPQSVSNSRYPQYLPTEGEIIFLNESHTLSKTIADGTPDVSFGSGGCLDLQNVFNGMTYQYSYIYHYNAQRLYFTLKNQTNTNDKTVKIAIFDNNGNLITVNSQPFYDTNLVDNQYGYIGITVQGNYLYLIGFGTVSRYILSENTLTTSEAENHHVEISFVNPFKDELTLKTSEKIKEVEIIDQSGRLVLKGNMIKLNTSLLEKGVYFINVTLESGRMISKKGVKL